MTYNLQAFVLTQKMDQLNFFNCYQANGGLKPGPLEGERRGL